MPSAAISDCNTCGFCICLTNSNTLNTPNKQGITGNTQGLLISTNANGNYAVQLWLEMVEGNIFTRGKTPSGWSLWVKL